MGNSANLLGLYLLLGIPLAGLYAYMYDRAQPEGRADEGVMSAFGLLRWIWVLPFWYLKGGLKAKDIKAPIVFGVYWILLASAIWLGSLATKQPPNPAHEGAAPAAAAEGGAP